MIIPNRQLFSVDSGQTQSGLETHQRCCYFPSFLVVKMFSGADKTAHAAASTRQPPLFTGRQRLPVVATSEATTSFLKMDFTWSQTETAHICEASATLVSSQGCCDTPAKDAVPDFTAFTPLTHTQTKTKKQPDRQANLHSGRELLLSA